MTPAHRRGHVLVAAAAIVWSLAGLIFRLIGSDIETLLCGRALFAGFFLLLVLAINTSGRPFAAIAGLGWPGFLVAFFFALDSTCYMASLHFTSVAHLAVILSLTPLFAALGGWLVMREAIRPLVAVAMVIAFAGVGVMVSGNLASGAWIGDLLALGVPTCFTVVTIITRRHPEVELLPAVCLAAILTGLAFLSLAHFGEASAKDLLLMAVLGLIEFGVGLLLYLAGARLVPPAEATLMSLLETVLAPLWVWAFVAEDPGWRALAGGALVLSALGGVAITDLRAGRRRR